MHWLSIIPKLAEISARRVAAGLLPHLAGKVRAAFRMFRWWFLSPPRHIASLQCPHILLPSCHASLHWLSSKARAPRYVVEGSPDVVFLSGKACAEPALCRKKNSNFGAKHSFASVPCAKASAPGRAAEQNNPEPCSRLRAAFAPTGLRIRASALMPPESATRKSAATFGAPCLACFQEENTPLDCSPATAACL